MSTLYTLVVTVKEDDPQIVTQWPTPVLALWALSKDTQVDSAFHYIKAECFMSIDGELVARQWVLEID